MMARPGPDTHAPLPRTIDELRALVREMAEGQGVPSVVVLWCLRAWVEGFRGGMSANLSTARDDALTLLALIDAELYERDGWRPS